MLVRQGLVISALNSFFFLKDLFIYFMYMNITVAGFRPPEEGIGSHNKWLWATMWLLGIELRTSGRTVSALISLSHHSSPLVLSLKKNKTIQNTLCHFKKSQCLWWDPGCKQQVLYGWAEQPQPRCSVSKTYFKISLLAGWVECWLSSKRNCCPYRGPGLGSQYPCTSS